MDENEESLDSSVIEEHFFNLSQGAGDLSSITDTTTCRSQNQDEKWSTRDSHSSMEDEKRKLSPVHEATQNNHEISDHSVPCSQPQMALLPSSPTVGLVPTTNESTTTQQLKVQCPVLEGEIVASNEEVDRVSDSSSVDNDLISYVSGEQRCNYYFPVSQEQLCTISDDDSCDASFLQSISNSATAFNQQYQDKREEEDSSAAAADCFSPEAFLSSIPLFKKLKRKKATSALPELSITDLSTVSQSKQSDQCSSYSTSNHGLILPKPNYTVVMHDSSQGVPIAPRPDPNSNVSCYVLVVPVPLYSDKFVPQENLLLQQDQIDNMPDMAPLQSQERITEVEPTPIVTSQLPDVSPMHPPDWTPKPLKATRTPLPSTRVRVSPSPHKGSKSSPVITVSTTTTPIQPLRGNKQQYVIVQGTNRHLKGIAGYRDSFCTPTVAENHQPIYLQGLPPQGFRRLRKAKENACTERTRKRSLEPLFSKTSVPASHEATVPQMDKSPLTCIRNRAPCDREVPQSDRLNSDKKLSTEDTVDASPARTRREGTDSNDVMGISELEYDEEPALESENDKSDTVTITPILQSKRREDKERKKIRDRKYDAELKKTFEQLRHLVPRMQKNHSRGTILQETIKYIGILENKILDAGLWSTLQTQDLTEQERHSKNISEDKPEGKARSLEPETGRLPSSTPCTVPDVSDTLDNTTEETPTLSLEEKSSQIPQHNTVAALTSPIILSLTNEDGSCTLVSPEGAVVTNDIDLDDSDGHTVLLEEMPLSIPFPQIQLLPVDTNASPVLTPQSSDEVLSQEPHPRLIPFVEVPGYTDSSEHREDSRGEHISPQRDVFLNAMTTISNEGLNDLGVTLSPLGILLSPGGDVGKESTITVVVEDTNSVSEETVVLSSGVVPDVCTDMTSIAASVEITTDHWKKMSPPTNGRTRRSSSSRAVQTVPSVSPLQLGDSAPSTPRNRNRRVLQDHGNLEDVRSPVGDSVKRRRRKFKDRSPERSFEGVDENSTFATNQNHTPPGRVSGVILKQRRKKSSSRGGVDKKRMRRI